MLILGWVLIAFGIVGLFLPVLQGVLFLLLGLYVLSRESKTARRLVERLRERHPDVDKTLHRWKDRFQTRRPASKDG